MNKFDCEKCEENVEKVQKRYDIPEKMARELIRQIANHEKVKDVAETE